MDTMELFLSTRRCGELHLVPFHVTARPPESVAEHNEGEPHATPVSVTESTVRLLCQVLPE
jgi:hypothetical protein